MYICGGRVSSQQLKIEMKQTFKTSIAQEIWCESLNWTFELIDILNKANNEHWKDSEVLNRQK